MKKYRSKRQRDLFKAVLRKWEFKRSYGTIRYRPNAWLINAVGAAAFMTMSACAGAQESTVVMPEVVVSGRQLKDEKSYKPTGVSSEKYTGPLRDIPQTITVVPQSVIEEQNATSLREVLRNVPGISIQAGEGGTPAGDQMSIRGYSARTDLFIDGVRDFGGYSRDPFNMEQVEVIKGPASSYGGRGSTGGSINMESKEATLDPMLDASVGFGSDHYQRWTADINQPIPDVTGVAVRVNAMWHESEYPGREIAENQRWGMAPTITFGLESPTRTTLSYFHLEQDNVPDYGVPWVPAANVPLAAYGDQPSPASWQNFYGLIDRDYEDVTTDLLTAKVEHDFSEELSLRNQIRYGETYRDSIITAPRFESNNSTNIRRSDWKSRDQIDKILTNQTEMTAKFETGQLEHTLVPGIEFNREDDLNWTRVKTGPDSSATSLFSPNPDDAYTEDIQRNGAYTQATSNSVAVYAFDTVALNEHWDVVGGLRWDYFNVDYFSRAAAGGTDVNLGRIDRMLSWRTGLVYKPVEIGSIYAAYGTSFNPAAESLTLSTTATATNNFNVDPEESHTVELGTKWDLLDERLLINGAVFRTEKTNVRTQDPTDVTDVIVLEGEQRVDGLELGAAGSITEDWKIFAAYTLLKSEITSSKNASEVGNELSNTPEHTFSLWNTYALPLNFEAGVGVQFVDDRYSSNANTRQAPEYWVADAMLAYNVNEDITLRLNGYNLANHEYIDRVGGGHFIPGAARSVTVTSEFKF